MALLIIGSHSFFVSRWLFYLRYVVRCVEMSHTQIGQQASSHSELLQGLSIKSSASFRMLATKASTEQHQVSAGPLTCDQHKDQINQRKMDPQDKHIEKGKHTNDNDEQNILVKIEALVDNGQVGLVAQM